MSLIQFGNAPKINPSNYAHPANCNGNKFLRLYETNENNWLFAHRENAPKGAVHILLIVEKDGEQFIRLLITKRPPFGGQLTLECPAGLRGDQSQGETALEAANREVLEETGYQVLNSHLMPDNEFVTSPGMTTEEKAFVLAWVKGEPEKPLFDGEDEARIIVDTMDVPISTFADREKFMNWLAQMKQDGYKVALDVISARGLMPETKGGRLDIPA